MGNSRYTTVEIVFIASMIALDFAFGLVVRPLLTATGVFEIIRVDMIVPLMLMLVTRLVVDRFGVLILYEFVWGLLAVIAMPTSYGLPGLLKLIPSLAYGIILDSFMQLFPRRTLLRLSLASIVGGVINQFVFLGIKMAFGLPWSTAVKILFGINLVTHLLVTSLAAGLSLLVWNAVRRSGWAARISGWRSS